MPLTLLKLLPDIYQRCQVQKKIMREIFMTRCLGARARERSDRAGEGVGGGCPPSHGRELFQFSALNGAIWCILK